MKKTSILLSLVLSLFGSYVKELDVKKFNKAVASKKLVVVDFYANYCKSCREFAPILESVAGKFRNVSFYKFSIEGAKENALRESLNVTVIPTLIFYKKSRQVHRIVTRLSEAALIREINRYKN